MTSPSSENSVRRLAEKIHRLSREPISGTPEEMERDEVSQIESLLSEAMEKKIQEFVKHPMMYSGNYLEMMVKAARSAAYRDAIEIVETYIWFEDGSVPMPLDNRYRKEIADKLRRKASEYSQ